MTFPQAKGKIIRKTAADIKAPTPRELARLRQVMSASVDATDVPPRDASARRPIVRDALGRMPRKPPSLIRDAILVELGRRNMTRYELWKRARRLHPKLPNSAVYEFLLSQRAISVDYCDALLKALQLGVAPLRRSA